MIGDAKRILFASARMTPPFYFGGAEKSNLTLALRLVTQHHVGIEFLGSYTHFQKGTDHLLSGYLERLKDEGLGFTFDQELGLHYMHQGMLCTMTSKDRYLEQLSQQLQLKRYNAVVTMLEYAPETIALCHDYGVKVLLWVMDTFDLGLKSLIEGGRPDEVLCTSNYVRQVLWKRFQCPAIAFYPLFEFDWYRVSERHPHSITMVNPIPEKGVKVFIEIARRSPKRHFLLVEGWRPVQLTLPDNATYWPRCDDMRVVYAQTQLLLVPSLWPEAFGRVVVEACINGIPVIASRLGGISEAMGESGVLIDDVSDVDAWLRAIHEFDNPIFHADRSNKALFNAARFAEDWSASFLELIP